MDRSSTLRRGFGAVGLAIGTSSRNMGKDGAAPRGDGAGMNSERRQTPARIVRWLDRWRYLGAIAPSTVLLLIGARGPKPSLLETPAGFAQYMARRRFGLGAAVTRPLHSYLQHRYRPWQAAG